MAGAAISSGAVAAAAGIDISSGSTLTPAVVNTFRIAAVADRLTLHVCSPQPDTQEFFNLCLSLARGIDYAVANCQVPGRVQDLPRLLKQVCLRNTDAQIQAAIMVLMISVKNACKSGWFLPKDSEELLTLADEIGRSFCTVRDMNTEASSSEQIISTVMTRFYPRMKMGQILAFLEVKPGYGTYVIDFHISKNARPSPEEKIRLFVVQTENVETSSCIISPPQVNFLLNGKGVDKRTNVVMGTGPQVPTVVTTMLKFGTNLLQAVGQFNGSYIIVVAYMSIISNPDPPALQDYVQPAVAALDSDTEIIEGPSRISLNCPISFRRIKTPVKGHSCKHRQCFDFDNFVDINTTSLSWRCPNCNQSVSYIDIRIDQNMVKILKEVGDNVVDVIISADGSWKAVAESNDETGQAHDKSQNCQQDGPAPQESCSISDIPADILDLTVGDDVMMDIEQLTYETQDRKPNLDNLQNQSNIGNVTTPLGMNNTSEHNQTAAPIEDDFWSGMFLSSYASEVLDARSDAQIIGGSSGSAAGSSCMLSPVLTDAVSPALSRELEAFHESALVPTSTVQSQISPVPLQHTQYLRSIPSNEYGRIPSAARPMNRTPIAVQALPAHPMTSMMQQRSSFNALSPQGQASASQAPALPPVADGFNSVSSSIERQQYSRAHSNPLLVSQLASSSLAQQPTPPDWNRHDRSFVSSQAAQQIAGGSTPSQLRSAYGASSVPMTEHRNLHQQQPLSIRATHGMGQYPSLIRPSGQLSPQFSRNHIPQGVAQNVLAQTPRNQISQGGTQIGIAQTALPGSSQRLMVSAQRSNLNARQHPSMSRQHPSVPVPIQTTMSSSSPSQSSFTANASSFRASAGDQRGSTGGQLQSAMRTDSSVDLPAEQNWRPTGRMRGSLSGRAYSDALSQIIQPTQPVQAARPPLNMIPPPPGIPVPLQVLVTNNRNAHASQLLNYPQTESTSVAGSSGVQPEVSSGMQ